MILSSCGHHHKSDVPKIINVNIQNSITPVEIRNIKILKDTKCTYLIIHLVNVLFIFVVKNKKEKNISRKVILLKASEYMDYINHITTEFLTDATNT